MSTGIFDPVCLQAAAPDRPVHWRWLRAKRAVEQNRPLDRRRDDQWVWTLARFLRAQATATDEATIDELAYKYPVLFWVHRLFTGTQDRQVKMRDQLEARLLAQDFDPDVTAMKVSLTREQVLTYEALCFNVRDRLQSVGWITSSVMGRGMVDGFNPKANSDLVLKLAGWVYGTLAVDLVAGKGFDGRPPNSIAGLNEGIDTAEGFDTRLKSYLATRFLGVDSITAGMIFQHAMDFRRREDDRAKVRIESGADAGELTALKTMIDALAAVGLNTIKATDADGNRTMFPAAEPRAAMAYALANGQASEPESGVRFPEVAAHDR